MRNVKYGRDEYRFRMTPNGMKHELYKMITSNINIGGETLFSYEFERTYHAEMEDLFSKLTVSDEQGEMILREYTDYRGYLDYEIEVISDGKSQMFSKIYGEKSGGETQMPYMGAYCEVQWLSSFY
ncbi:MAG: SbcC/MukB-like Walker B domain-containing protein [Anaerocolumna jejuensis]